MLSHLPESHYWIHQIPARHNQDIAPLGPALLERIAAVEGQPHQILVVVGVAVDKRKESIEAVVVAAAGPPDNCSSQRVLNLGGLNRPEGVGHLLPLIQDFPSYLMNR